jgi:6-pyruvoyltetrahydropterin/6-carboxytetrahydropterin synthase
MVYVTRKTDFCAAHRLYDPALTAEANRERFGDCVNLHGHSYTLEVTFAGEPHRETGMIIHLSRLDTIIKERVVRRLDHRYLNEDVEAFRTEVPTLELLTRFVWNQLDGAVPGAVLHRVRIDEDNQFFADYYGDG